MARLHRSDPDQTVKFERERRERRWKEQNSSWDLSDELLRGLNDATREVLADPVMAAKLRRRRTEAHEGTLVWPSDEEIEKEIGDSA